MLDLLFPPRCTLCHKGLTSSAQPHLCRTCRRRILSLRKPCCDRCLQPFTSAPDQAETDRKHRTHLCGRCMGATCHDQLYACGLYDDALADLIQGLKFGKQLSLAPVLGALLVEHTQKELASSRYDCIVPVPIHWRSLIMRGFNHAEQLAHHVATALDRPCDRLGLRKPQVTPEQAHLSMKQRQKNLRHAFRTARSYHGESCLLVDDVYTTGATAENCARVLKGAGALRVDVLTVARTI